MRLSDSVVLVFGLRGRFLGELGGPEGLLTSRRELLLRPEHLPCLFYFSGDGMKMEMRSV